MDRPILRTNTTIPEGARGLPLIAGKQVINVVSPCGLLDPGFPYDLQIEE